MAYATVAEVEAGFRTLTTDERNVCTQLLEEAAVIIDAYNEDADESAKDVVSCRIVRRAIGDGMTSVPMGASQGSVSALGYSQSWTMSGGASGELYLGKVEKKLLGVGDRIGARSPVENLVPTND